jgi:hypothetical protein
MKRSRPLTKLKHLRMPQLTLVLNKSLTSPPQRVMVRKSKKESQLHPPQLILMAESTLIQLKIPLQLKPPSNKQMIKLALHQLPLNKTDSRLKMVHQDKRNLHSSMLNKLIQRTLLVLKLTVLLKASLWTRIALLSLPLVLLQLSLLLVVLLAGANLLVIQLRIHHSLAKLHHQMTRKQQSIALILKPPKTLLLTLAKVHLMLLIKSNLLEAQMPKQSLHQAKKVLLPVNNLKRRRPVMRRFKMEKVMLTKLEVKPPRIVLSLVLMIALLTTTILLHLQLLLTP